MKLYLAAYAGAFITLLALDAVWLTLTAKSFYQARLGELMAPDPNFSIAALFYVFFAMAVVILASLPGVAQQSLPAAIGMGAVLGLAAYGTYDITNLATLKNWPVAVTVVDLIWGTFVTSASAAGGYAVARYFS